MTYFVIYLLLGLVGYIWMYRRKKEEIEPTSTLFATDEIGLVMLALLWPVMIPFCLIDNRIQEKAIEDEKNKTEYIPEGLSLLHGKVGVTKTSHSPSGKVTIEKNEYESQSVHSYIEKGMDVRVVGHSMRHLKIEPAEPDAAGQSHSRSRNPITTNTSKLSGWDARALRSIKK
jgi:membrane-bound ClpP family serine protease